MLIQLLTVILLIPFTLFTIYYLFLAIIALFSFRDEIEQFQSTAETSFAILIPAHNEELTIRNTIHSCQNLDYPKEKYTIFVIADNCTDATAEISSAESVEVLERIDKVKQGKGYALSWAFKKLLNENYDAYLILDADCVIDSHALVSFDMYFVNGAQLLQANDVIANPDDTAMSYALAVGNQLENEYFYAPKSFLRLAVFLRGTGMIIHREILQKIPWDAFSIAEDADYSLRIFKEKININFIKEVKVASKFPVTNEQLKVQRNRWAKGNLNLSKVYSLKFMRDGFLTRNLLLFDAGWTLLVMSRPLVLVGILLAFISATMSCIIAQSMFSIFLLKWAILIIVGVMTYFGFGIVSLGINNRRIKYLIQTPLFVLRLAKITISGLFGKVQHAWNRTPR